jgi:hypothetical protein
MVQRLSKDDIPIGTCKTYDIEGKRFAICRDSEDDFRYYALSPFPTPAHRRIYLDDEYVVVIALDRKYYCNFCGKLGTTYLIQHKKKLTWHYCCYLCWKSSLSPKW